MKRPIILCFTCMLLFLNGQVLAQAQTVSARDELLSLVPPDAGFCLSVQNLRDEAERWGRSSWIKKVRSSSLGQTIENAPELHRLALLDNELKRRFGVDWVKLRDDIFGDAIVLAYWPALPNRPEQEQGLLLIRARRGDLLKQLVDRINEEQLKSKELKRLEDREYRGVKYQLREDQTSEHFLLVDGNVLAFTGKKSLVEWIIDRRKGNVAEKNVIAQQVNRAGAQRSLAALWINPRAFDLELEQGARDPGPDGVLRKTFLSYWRPLEAVVLSVSDAEDFEIRLAIQARARELPSSVGNLFMEPTRPAELWSRFPDDAILGVAQQIDASRMVESIGAFLTPDNRKFAFDSLQKYVGTAIKLDLARQVLPNIGPEWGMFIAAAGDPKNCPDILSALAVQPGDGATKVDQALLQGVHFLAFLAKLANSDRLAIETVWQDKVEVSYMTGAKVFPEGMRPAWALKDGFLVFASSPEAVLRFRSRKDTAKMSAVNGEVPVLMLSTTELAKLLRARREQVIEYMTEKNKSLHRDAANQALEDALRVMDMINHVTFLQGSGNGQLTWTLRVRPRMGN